MPNKSIPLENLTNIQIIHQAADASWNPNAQSVSALHVDGDLLTATVFDKSAGKFVWLRSAETKGNLQNTETLQALFPEKPENLKIFVNSPKTVLIPAAVFEESAKEDFFKLNHTLEPNEKVEVSYARNINAYLLFALDSNLERQIRGFQPKNILHEDVAWLEALFIQHKNNPDTFVHMHVSEKMLWVAAFRDAGLLLYNIFPAETAEDKLYFAMFVSEQLRINPHKDQYFLSGNIQKHDETFALFSKYIKELKLEKRPEIFQYSLPLQELPEHLYFKAFCTPVCE
ncbi:MAG: DUF3822 family protein [Flavobacterium sp.]|nr:MAG: DUF3822 family protein [Flavobacterium sp.]